MSAGQHSHDGFEGLGNNGANDTPVLVPKAVYVDLLQTARHYQNLKQNLILSGVDEQHIMVLSQDIEYPVPQQPTMRYSLGNKTSPSTQTQTVFHSNPTIQKYHMSCARPMPQVNNHGSQPSRYGTATTSNSKQHDWKNHADADSEDESSYGHKDYGPVAGSTNGNMTLNERILPDRPQHPRVCQRTIALVGLSPQTNLADVTELVCGGQLLEIWIRAADHTCYVSFLREEDAVRFLEHTTKRDIYIKNKRIMVKWAERQFHLPGRVASRILAGATRNLVIRRCDSNLTEETIRDDLEHIHNLVVIKVVFQGNSCYIKTNSVHNAMYAQSCMMSRAKYKGSNIEWDLDECDRPIPEVNKTTRKPKPVPSIQPSAICTKNRFATLRRDDSDNDLSDDDIDSSSEFPVGSSEDGDVWTRNKHSDHNILEW